MRSFLHNLLTSFRTTSKPRITRRPPRRAFLQVEALEHRLVPTTLSPSLANIAPVVHTVPAVAQVNPIGSLINVTSIPPGDTITLEGDSNGGLQVFDGTTLLSDKMGNTTFKGITGMNIGSTTTNGPSNAVLFNDSKGMPIAQGGIFLLPSIGQLTLAGDATVAGTETYVAGSSAGQTGSISLPGPAGAVKLTFSATSVTDQLPLNGVFNVVEQASTQVGESGPCAFINGNSGAGGGNLSYEFKPNVILSANGANTVTTLCPVSPSGERFFQVAMNANGQTLSIGGTAAGVQTFIFAYGNGDSVITANNLTYLQICCYGTNDSVDIAANQAVVQVNGNSTTDVAIGFLPGGNIDNSTTQNIDQNIGVNGARSLSIDDASNSSALMNVSNGGTITGFGLFANNDVTIYFVNVVQPIGGPGIQTI